jgi:uncharacterized membrane-anchored protein YhcB (DUF1043 family)
MTREVTITLAEPYAYLALVYALIVGVLIGHLATKHGDRVRTQGGRNA